jgi:hypothetical protein
MGKRKVTISIKYSVAKAWNVGKRINISFPHQTNSMSIACVCASIKCSKNKGTVQAELIITDDISTNLLLELIYQDTSEIVSTNLTDNTDDDTTKYQNRA